MSCGRNILRASVVIGFGRLAVSHPLLQFLDFIETMVFLPLAPITLLRFHRMLEDPSFSHTVCWAPAGNSFVVKVSFFLFLFPVQAEYDGRC
jgi:hypothetical protein